MTIQDKHILVLITTTRTSAYISHDRTDILAICLQGIITHTLAETKVARGPKTTHCVGDFGSVRRMARLLTNDGVVEKLHYESFRRYVVSYNVDQVYTQLC